MMIAELRVMWVLSFIACAMVNISGCTSAHVAAVSTQGLQDLRLKSAFSVARSADWRLSASTATGLVVPQDSQHQLRKRSAFNLNKSLKDELQLAFPATDHLGAVERLDTALQLAKARGKEVLFWPVLGEVEDNLNTRAELSEGRGLHPDKKRKPDSIVFTVLIYDVRSKTLLDNARVSARGRMLGREDEGPLGLYAQAAKQYVNTIAGKARN